MLQSSQFDGVAFDPFSFQKDEITGPAFIVIKAADEFKDKTTAPNAEAI